MEANSRFLCQTCRSPKLHIHKWQTHIRNSLQFARKLPSTFLGSFGASSHYWKKVGCFFVPQFHEGVIFLFVVTDASRDRQRC